jgi:hypothetical protein
MVTEQGGRARVGDEYEVSAAPAVTAIGAGQGFELFALDRNTSVSSIARS